MTIARKRRLGGMGNETFLASEPCPLSARPTHASHPTPELYLACAQASDTDLGDNMTV